MQETKSYLNASSNLIIKQQEQNQRYNSPLNAVRTKKILNQEQKKEVLQQTDIRKDQDRTQSQIDNLLKYQLQTSNKIKKARRQEIIFAENQEKELTQQEKEGKTQRKIQNQVAYIFKQKTDNLIDQDGLNGFYQSSEESESNSENSNNQAGINQKYNKMRFTLPQFQKHLVVKKEDKLQKTIEIYQKFMETKKKQINKILADLDKRIDKRMQDSFNDFKNVIQASLNESKKEKEELIKAIQELEYENQHNSLTQRYKQKSKMFKKLALQYQKIVKQIQEENLQLRRQNELMKSEIKFSDELAKQKIREKLRLSKSNEVLYQQQKLQNFIQQQDQTSFVSTNVSSLKYTSNQKKGSLYTDTPSTSRNDINLKLERNCASISPLIELNQLITEEHTPLKQVKQLEKGIIFKRKYQKLLKEVNQRFYEMSGLENIWLNCVQDLREIIKKRKHLKSQVQVTAKDLKLKDKEDLLFTFLSNEQVISYIQNQMFPDNSQTIIDLDVLQNKQTQIKEESYEGKESEIDKEPKKQILSPRIQRAKYHNKFQSVT